MQQGRILSFNKLLASLDAAIWMLLLHSLPCGIHTCTVYMYMYMWMVPCFYTLGTSILTSFTISENVSVLVFIHIKGVLVNDRPGLWAVAGDQVILALHGVEMNELRYIQCMYIQ